MDSWTPGHRHGRKRGLGDIAPNGKRQQFLGERRLYTGLASGLLFAAHKIYIIFAPDSARTQSHTRTQLYHLSLGFAFTRKKNLNWPSLWPWSTLIGPQTS